MRAHRKKLSSCKALQELFIYNHRRFYNFPSIFCSFSPLTRTYPPNNREKSRHRNRGIWLRLNSFSPARQSVFRTFHICIAIKAFLLAPFSIPLLYSQKRRLASIFLYKIALPLKKLSKKPWASTPVFSKDAIKCAGVAIVNALSL